MTEPIGIAMILGSTRPGRDRQALVMPERHRGWARALRAARAARPYPSAIA